MFYASNLLMRLSGNDMKTDHSVAKTGNSKAMAKRLSTTSAARVLSLVLLFAVLSPVKAQFTYATNNGRITITGYTGAGGAVTIPDNVGGLPVTSIGSTAFSNRITVTMVTFPNSLTNVGANAFYSCTSMTNVTVGNNVISIGSSAFLSCSASG